MPQLTCQMQSLIKLFIVDVGSPNINILISVAILITGGRGEGTDQSAEMFLPWSNTSCQLPSLPEMRFDHVQSRQLLDVRNENRTSSSSFRHVMLQYFGVFQPSSGIMMTELRI